MKTNLKTTLAALLLATTIALPGAALAQDECAVINQIINSGLDRKNPFAAVAGYTLPNADTCEVVFGDQDDESNSFECSWNEENEAILEKMEEEENELFDASRDHDGGSDVWDEAKEFFDKANYWIKTYNEAIRTTPIQNQQQVNLLNSWKEIAERYEWKAYAVEKEAMELDREKEEAEAKHEAKEAEVEQFRREIAKLSEQQEGALYTGVYACFKNSAIDNATAYTVNAKRKSWKQDGGCSIDIRYGPTLYVYCPNPNYQSQ